MAGPDNGGNMPSLFLFYVSQEIMMAYFSITVNGPKKCSVRKLKEK